MKSWNFIDQLCAGLCLLFISTTAYTPDLRAADLPANAAKLETSAIWLPHRTNYFLSENAERTHFEVNTNQHSLPTNVLTQCGYKMPANLPLQKAPPKPPLISMRIVSDQATGQALPWPGSRVTRDAKRHAIVYQTTSTPSFSFPRTKADPASPPSCLYFFRLNDPDTRANNSAGGTSSTTLASQLVLKLTRNKGDIRYAPLYFELSAPLAQASVPPSAQSAQKVYNIALMLNSSALYRTASTTTHQFAYFQLPWALVIKNLELSPETPCQITWHNAALHTSHCAVSDRLQVLMPTYPIQPLPEFNRSFLLPQHGADKPSQFPADAAPLPAIPPKPIVFAMLTTLESGFTPFWQENLESLTMLSGPDHTSKIFTQTLSFVDHGS
ncbi:MAG: hypothetical protein KUG59_02825 [Parvibaculaceae bacterium]|nr:hypothetical protein [Parvibaculaceae bacterium]